MSHRRHQRASWLDNDLRTRRAELLRNRWKDLALVLMALVVSAAGMSLAVRHSPLLTGVVIGVYVGATAVATIVLLSVVDGTFHPRLGRLVERSVGTDLRRVPGIHGVVSDVSFEHGNVDHVVLTSRGCLAVEVKSSFSRRRDLAKVADLAGKVTQTQYGAQRVQLLLHSRGVDVPVRPVLLFTGPGAPFMPPVVHYDDVTITCSTDPTTWLESAIHAGDQLDLDTARRAADELLAYREQRTDYEQARTQLRAEKPH
ncbi:nuclease-related domain-containing protein [Modestobacter sp. VKM Ac-2977]|uniref:nuclease-related domain-containing protein n=1 Tax=Modestobacter sp. VKM Ac-2977 TaxID=3004131 RepID=UPI0022AACEFB|nr:nuclease-related domain-containing protein [Modestobacter sp. VKM Ac-2977]MCZ2821060.1 nuclease-related domain-containing protein [Modestobacter sp. VKM Ac-2977]